MEKETVETVAETLYPITFVSIFTQRDKVDKNKERRKLFIEGAMWQAERMFNEEDLKEAFINGVGSGKYQEKYGDNAKGCMNFEYFLNTLKKVKNDKRNT